MYIHMLLHTRLTIYNTWYTIAAPISDETWSISPTHFDTFFYIHSIPIGIHNKNKTNKINNWQIWIQIPMRYVFLFDF